MKMSIDLETCMTHLDRFEAIWINKSVNCVIKTIQNRIICFSQPFVAFYSIIIIKADPLVGFVEILYYSKELQTQKRFVHYLTEYFCANSERDWTAGLNLQKPSCKESPWDGFTRSCPWNNKSHLDSGLREPVRIQALHVASSWCRDQFLGKPSRHMSAVGRPTVLAVAGQTNFLIKLLNGPAWINSFSIGMWRYSNH